MKHLFISQLGRKIRRAGRKFRVSKTIHVCNNRCLSGLKVVPHSVTGLFGHFGDVYDILREIALDQYGFSIHSILTILLSH